MTDINHRYWIIDTKSDEAQPYVGEFWPHRDVYMIDGETKVLATANNKGELVMALSETKIS
jgi:hypothetical protein